jgi:hypothetical protein
MGTHENMQMTKPQVKSYERQHKWRNEFIRIKWDQLKQ